jgi:hypothetical protein
VKGPKRVVGIKLLQDFQHLFGCSLMHLICSALGSVNIGLGSGFVREGEGRRFAS